jgi:hypothetical protein
MARIRSIKPEFFRNHKLYSAEQETGLPLRLAFAGLWTAADREGRFKWEPAELKLDALPFDDVDFSRVLHALTTRGYIVHYASGTCEFGWIPSWKKHQVINNREMASIIPEYITGQEITDASATREARVTVITKGKGKEGKGREGNIYAATPTAPAVSEDKALYDATWESFIGQAKTFANYGKEGKATKDLVKLFKARHPEEPDKLAALVLQRFLELTQSGEKFWKEQPFTPSALLPLFDRVMKNLENNRPWSAEDYAYDEEIPL